MERRQFFRISDVIQVSAKRWCFSCPCPVSRFVAYPFSSGEIVVPDDDKSSPFLVKLLVSLHQKIDAVLEYVHLEKSGFGDMEYKSVDISAGGISFDTVQEFLPTDLVELRLVLPLVPPIYLICYGKVIRREESTAGGCFRVALEFINMSEEIRRVIERYVLQRQRQTIVSKE